MCFRTNLKDKIHVMVLPRPPSTALKIRKGPILIVIYEVGPQILTQRIHENYSKKTLFRQITTAATDYYYPAYFFVLGTESSWRKHFLSPLTKKNSSKAVKRKLHKTY